MYCLLLVILCCVHLNPSLRLTNAATGSDPHTANKTNGSSSDDAILTATTTSSSEIFSTEGVSNGNSSNSLDNNKNESSINFEEETKTQQGTEITTSAEKTTTAASAGPKSESRPKSFPVFSGTTNLPAYSSVETNAATVKSNEAEGTSYGSSSGIRIIRTKQGKEDEVRNQTGNERKGWPSIRNCNYTYQADVDVVYVSCLNHESGNGENEEKTVRQEKVREEDMNPRSGDSLNQLSSPAEPHIFTPDLSIHALPSSSPSPSLRADLQASASLSESHAGHAADATKTTTPATTGPTASVATKTLLTVDLLISGFQIPSLNQSVFDILSVDLLNNNNNNNNKHDKEYMGANMRSLILSNNSITRIRGDCLHSMKSRSMGSLQHLDLSHNLISELTSETFDGFQSILSSLILSYNRLQSMDFLTYESSNASAAGIAAGRGSKLTHLDLRHNRLRVIRESCFMMHPLLRYINLSGNMIDTIDGGSFVSLLHLTHLDLSNNPLTNHADKLILTCFSHSLQVINLSNTSRGSMSSGIPAGMDPFVRQLILSHNHVSQISLGDFESDADHNSLQILDLSHNQIREIEDDALGRLLSLRELRLDQNLLSMIPQRLPSNLVILSMEQNSIKSLPDSCVSSLVRLQSLNLAGNQITNLHPDALKGLTSLMQLNLSGNSIRNLSYSMFHHCIKLQVLDISHNPITHLSSYTFSGLNSLNHLMLSHVATGESLMKIDSGTFTPLISLQMLDLSQSPGLFRALLHSNPQDVDDVSPLSFLTSVQQINLDFNQIPELNPEDLDALKYWLQEQTVQRRTLRSISLRELEWKCDHSIQWLIKWIKSLHPRMSFASTSSSFSTPLLPCCSSASADVPHQYSTSSSSSSSSSSSQPPPTLIPLSSGETMASDATNSSSRSRITLGSKEPLMQVTSPPPSTFIPASASLASTSDPAAVAAAAIVTSSMSMSAENEIPSSSAEASLPSFRLDHVTDIICSSPENLRGRSLLSLTEQEILLQPVLIQMHSPREAEDEKTVKAASAGKIEREMRMDQNSEGTHPSSPVSTSDQRITADSTAQASKSLAEEEKENKSGSSPSSLSSPPPLLVS